MSVPLTTIEIDQGSAALLRRLLEQARARGTTLAALLRPLAEETNGTAASQPPPQRNEAMFAALQASVEVLKEMPCGGSTQDSLKILYEGRAGGMYGYEPNE